MSRPRKKFGYDRPTTSPRLRLRFLPTWLTGSSYRGTNWRNDRKRALASTGGKSGVDGTDAGEVAHINPWYLHDGENIPGSRANKQSNLIPVAKGDRTIEYAELPEQGKDDDDR